MAINFPDSPTIGDEFTGGGFTWTWSGTSWEKLSASAGIPSGATSDRPTSPSIGDQFYNGTLGVLEIYTSSGWLPASGGSNFNISLSGSESTTVLDKEYFAGSYTITSSIADTEYDIYLYNSLGTLVGYSNTPSITASSSFNKIVVLGGTVNNLLSFDLITTFIASNTDNETSAGPVIVSVSPSYMNSIDDSIIITGKNFASNIRVYFIGTDQADREAKSVVYNSSTEIIATRPDDFPEDIDPYTIRLENPGVQSPVGSNVHIATNSVTAGTTPSWQTDTNLPLHSDQVPYTTTLQASDVEGSAITYSVVVGSLPTWASLDSGTGEISGTPSGETEGQTTTFSIRATDAGGNFVDKSFTMTANTYPVWSTASGNLTTASTTSSYSYQLAASDAQSITYSIVSGSLPGGLSLSTSGLISGTPNGTPGTTFTVSAEDSLSLSTTRDFYVPLTVLEQLNASTTWIAPSGVTSVEYALVAGGGSGADYGGSNASAGGGGAGGVLTGTVSVNPGQSYPIVIGAGGASTSGGDANGNYGNNSTAFGLTAIRGGFGATAFDAGGNGGSGGGASRTSGGQGTPGQGNNGGTGLYQDTGSGGGGKATVGQNPTTSKSGNGGSGASYFGVAVGGGGGGGSAVGYTRGSGGLGGGGIGGPGRGNGSTNTGGGGGGGGGSDTSGGAGGSGTLLLQYTA